MREMNDLIYILVVAAVVAIIVAISLSTDILSF